MQNEVYMAVFFTAIAVIISLMILSILEDFEDGRKEK